MADASTTTQSGSTSTTPPTNPADAEILRPLGRSLLGLYLLLLPVMLLWILVAVFPPATPTATQTQPAGGPVAGSSNQPGAVQQTTTVREPKFGPATVLKFPVNVTIGPLSDDQGLILLAILAGALGSYLHAAQSFAAYVGNRTAKRSWVWWYLLRAPIGAALGVLFYFVVRAGLTTGVTDAVSAYGVVAFAALAGMFSKQATDKLAEVFDTLFRTQKPAEYHDKLTAPPAITSVTPSPVPAGTTDVTLTVTGTGFAQGASVRMQDTKLETEFKSATQLTALVPAASRPAPDTNVDLVVVNPEPAATKSPPFTLHFD
ncbi:MAG: IPT/TIG domain-containing protein [Gammaproteobacteria bacterium]